MVGNILKMCLRNPYTVLYQKRFKKEKESRRRLQDQLDQEHKRRSKLEEAIKTNSSNTEVLRLLSEFAAYDREREKEKEKSERLSGTSEQLHAVSEAISSGVFNGNANSGNSANNGGGNSQSSHQSASTDTPNENSWNYSSLDLMNSGASSFWKNYSAEIAQELELKARQQQAAQQSAQHASRSDRSGSKSPLQDTRSTNYYKNSVLFSTAT
ncbi:hypothetical protein V9T40_002804 [Parthenolecanium corni]|uniref:Uncharacterized protein n=1 Tax=Parthenolecanium corni TaxID=536013 RepID=A0AAN9TJ48_9HEMI